MVSLSDSEWLTVFFSMVALLLFCFAICLIINALLCAMNDDSALPAEVKPMRAVNTNIVLDQNRQLCRTNHIINPTAKHAPEPQHQAVRIDIYREADESTSTTTVTSVNEDNSCRALVPVSRQRSVPELSASSNAPAPPKRWFSDNPLPQKRPTFVSDAVRKEDGPHKRPAPFKWCPVRRAFVQDEEEGVEKVEKKVEPTPLMYSGRYRRGPTNPFVGESTPITNPPRRI
ncbi:unnamed protein product [Bursaphelenchus okinawaensis]|uniref:Uncharacterized protein n=1 Tax=Bursaphelenchus okinawaensis TaxID=465554 RepID=A0A811LDV6_9BILA|nr:unnamed protein product [Bursaphelenchus okinawaensis]CAG9120857.1 unnamed protein product [Bursaphelenchus okinawaensis]